MLDFLNNSNIAVMQKSLDVLWQRQAVISDNIANVSTPGYKAKRLEFENILQHNIEKLNNSSSMTAAEKSRATEEAIASTSPVLVTDTTTESNIDGNNVNVDSENIELSRNTLQYQYLIRKISDEFRLLKLAITEGKG